MFINFLHSLISSIDNWSRPNNSIDPADVVTNSLVVDRSMSMLCIAVRSCIKLKVKMVEIWICSEPSGAINLVFANRLQFKNILLVKFEATPIASRESRNRGAGEGGGVLGNRRAEGGNVRGDIFKFKVWGQKVLEIFDSTIFFTIKINIFLRDIQRKILVLHITSYKILQLFYF